MVHRLVIGNGRIATGNHDVPGKARRGVIGILATTARRGQFKHVTMRVGSARVRRVAFLALGVVGQHDIDLAVDRVRFDVFRTVHLGCTQKVGRTAGLDQNIRLTVEVVFSCQRAFAKDQRHPVKAAIFVELGNKQGAVFQEVHVGCAIIRVVFVRSHEFVEIVEALIIAGIGNNGVVLVDDDGGAFVLEAAKGCAFFRHRGRIIRIDFNHPAKLVRLVRVFFDIEAVKIFNPRVPAVLADAQTLVVAFFAGLGDIAAKVTVEVFFCDQNRTPRGFTARTVVKRTDDTGTGRVGVGLEAVMTGSRAGNLHFGVDRGNAACIIRPVNNLPFAAGFLDFDDRMTVGSNFMQCLFFGCVHCVLKARPHQFGIGVFVADAQKAVVRILGSDRKRHVANIVAVITKLFVLCLGVDLTRDECRCIGDDLVAPTDQHAGVVAISNCMGFGDLLRDRLEGQGGG